MYFLRLPVTTEVPLKWFTQEKVPPQLGSAQGHNTHLFRECFPLRLVLECGNFPYLSGRICRKEYQIWEVRRKQYKEKFFVYQKLEN